MNRPDKRKMAILKGTVFYDNEDNMVPFNKHPLPQGAMVRGDVVTVFAEVPVLVLTH